MVAYNRRIEAICRADAGDMAGHMTRRLVQSWFEVWEIEPGVFAIEEPFHKERVKSYLVVGSGRAVLV